MLKAEVYTFEENKQNSIKKNRRAMLGHRHLLNFLEVEVACSVCVFYYLLVAFKCSTAVSASNFVVCSVGELSCRLENLSEFESGVLRNSLV